MKKIILSAAILCTCISACKKKDTPAPDPSNKNKELLTSQTWHTSGAVSNVPINTDNDNNTPNSTDLWSSFADCEKDNTLLFFSDGTGSYTDTGITCSNASAGFFNWTLSNSILTLNYLNSSSQVVYTETLTLISVDDSTLKLAYASKTDPNGVSYTEIDIYSK